MKKRKSIVTRKGKFFKIADRLIWLIPLILYLVIIFHNYTLWKKDVSESFHESALVGILYIIVWFFICLIASIPIMLICWSVIHTIKKSVIKNTTFNVLQDYDYYRDKLTGISPADISMLTDLEIESRKDISALVLKYTMLGVVSTDDGKVNVLNPNHPELLESDRILLNAFSTDKLTPSVARQWKNLAKNEVVQKGYLRDRRQDSNSKNSGSFSSCSMGCLTPIVILIVIGLFAGSPLFEDITKSLDSIDDNASNTEVIRIMAESPHTAFSYALLLLFGLLALAAVVLPIAAIIYHFVRAKSENFYTRTALGEELTEEIYGMKNFIHDFSELSHADKERLILWDDFLIYAVLLEENSRIVKEICDMKQMNLMHFNI